ncbi:HAD hydrolase-like protein [Alcaligenaceae bacterium C4P045]|nr:HAD hydrolase-like protein [Alcaligenaceae bacterium C4P045]
MRVQLAAFDFDGTLADTFPWFDSIFDSVAERYGFRHATAEEKKMLRTRDARGIMAFLGIPLWKAPMILSHVRSRMAAVTPELLLFDGMADQLARLKSGGVRLAVVSSNAENNVRQVLGPAAEYIDTFACGADVFGKPAKLKRLARDNGIAGERAILIGDELRDIAAARASGWLAGAVAWGYNDGDTLAAESPDRLFTDPQEMGDWLLSDTADSLL